MANKILIGSIGMVLVILTSSIYFMWPENVKIVVDNSKTDFFVWENNFWTLGASEYINLYNGSKKLYALDRGVTYDVQNNVTNIIRIVHYPNNVSFSVVYSFDGTVNTVELIPITERLTCINCEGLILQYEYKNIDYKGVSRDAMSPEKFGHNMNVEWDGSAYYSKVFQYATTSDKLVIKYKPFNGTNEFNVRMFDPYYNISGGQIFSIYNLSDGNIQYWTLDVNNSLNMYANSINRSFNFSRIGNVHNITGKINSGLNFTNITTQYLNASDIGNINDITVCFWMLKTVGGTGESEIIGTSTAGAAQSYFLIRWSDGAGYNGLYTQFATSASVYRSFNSSYAWTDRNTWHHVCGVRQGVNFQFWVDGIDRTGVQKGGGGTPSGVISTLKPLRVGYNSDFTSNGVNMSIDEIGIWNRTLSGAEISLLYNISKDGYTTGQYPFNVSESLFINLSINDYQRTITVEVGSNLTVWANYSTNGTICLDSNHPEYGINFSCGINNTNSSFIPTYFRTTSFNDTNITRNITINSTSINVTLGVSAHQYDEVVGMTLNVTTLSAISSPQLLIYVNDTLSNNLSLVSGDALNLFSDSTSEKQFAVNHDKTKLVEYFHIKKSATVIKGTFNINGTTNYKDTFPLPNSSYLPYVVMEATGIFTPGVFYGDTVLSSFIDPSTGNTKYVVWDNVSSDTYEVKRAKVYNAIFFSGSLSGKGVSYLATTDTSDVGLKAYNINIYTTYNGGTSHNGEYNAVIGTNAGNVSTWFYGCSSYERVRGSINGTEVFNFYSSGGCSSWLDLDKSANEKQNPISLQVGTDQGGGGISSSVTAYFLTMANVSQITFSLTGNCGSYCVGSSTDYSSTLGIPALSYWKENYTTTNTRIIVGNLDGHWDWNYTGSFTNYNSTQNFNASINTYLSTCVNDNEGYCYVPVYAYSLYDGGIKITNISINLTTSNNPITISRTAIERFLNRSSGFTSIPLLFMTNINATLRIDDLKYDYLGGNKTYSVTAHTPDYSSNKSYNITFFYSRWYYTMPVDYFEFIPTNANSKNVSPEGQTQQKPIMNISLINYGGSSTNFYYYMNGSNSCINMSYSIPVYAPSGGFNHKFVNNTWTLVGTWGVASSEGLWMFTDYGCNNNANWQLWQPDIYFRMCPYDVDICSEELN